jgi:hypothetical protein
MGSLWSRVRAELLSYRAWACTVGRERGSDRRCSVSRSCLTDLRRECDLWRCFGAIADWGLDAGGGQDGFRAQVAGVAIPMDGWGGPACSTIVRVRS